MYENKIESEILDEASNELMRSFVGIIANYPPRKFYSQMSSAEKQTFEDWVSRLNGFCLKAAILSGYGSKPRFIHDLDELNALKAEGVDFLFIHFELSEPMVAIWLYEFYCAKKNVVQEFDSVKIKPMLVNAYHASASAEKTHFLNIAIQKNFFVIMALVFLVLATGLSNYSFICFIASVGAIMSFFMQFFLAKRIFDEDMVNIRLKELKGVGESEIMRSVIISTSIMKKTIDSIVKIIES